MNLFLEKDTPNKLVSFTGNLTAKGIKQLQTLIKEGAKYYFTLEYKVVRKADSWYSFSTTTFEKKEKSLIKFVSANNGFLLVKRGKALPFKDFLSAWKAATKFRKDISVKNWKEGRYEFRMRLTGESIRLYFPLNVIYRNFLAEYDFTTDWQKLSLKLANTTRIPNERE